MPDEFERHGRSKEENWNGGPSRSDARRRAAQTGEDEGRKPRSTRSDKKQCTGSPDGKHHGEGRLRQVYRKEGEPELDMTCRWMGYYYIPSASSGRGLAWWNCHHIEYCTECGGKVSESMDRRCPDYPGDPEQKARAEQNSLQWDRERQARAVRAARKPARPAGPLGYRKPKPS